MRAIAVILIFVGTSFAQQPTPKIVGETKVAAYKFVELAVDPTPADTAIIWDVFPEDNADIRELDGRLMFVAPPGVYKVKARLIRGKVVVTLRSSVTIGQTGPAPVALPIYAVVIEETAQASADRGQLYGNRELHTWLVAKGIKVRLYDQHAKDENGGIPVEIVPLLQSGKSVPRIWVFDARGKELYNGVIPVTPKELQGLLGKFAGS